jgi:hypothetical protein
LTDSDHGPILASAENAMDLTRRRIHRRMPRRAANSKKEVMSWSDNEA